MAEPAPIPGPLRPTHYDVGNGIRVNERTDRADYVAALEGQWYSPQLLSQRHGIGDLSLRCSVDLLQALGWRLDVDVIPGSVEPAGQASCFTQQHFRIGTP